MYLVEQEGGGGFKNWIVVNMHILRGGEGLEEEPQSSVSQSSQQFRIWKVEGSGKHLLYSLNK